MSQVSLIFIYYVKPVTLTFTIYSDGKTEYLAIIHHVPSEIIIIQWFGAQEIFINDINSCTAQYICGNRDAFFFLIL